jgi:hypothetical protein
MLALLLALDGALGSRVPALALIGEGLGHPLARVRLDVVVVHLDQVELLA